MTTSLYKGQIPIRMKGKTTCITHTGIKLDLFCQDCKQLACMRCLSDEHRGHLVCALSEITHRKKKDIQKFMVKTENIELVQIDRHINATEEQLADNDSSFTKFSQDLNKQTEKLKQDLDLIASQTLSRYQNMTSDNKKLLETYKNDLEIYKTQRIEQVQACNIALQRGCNILIYDTAVEVRSLRSVPLEPNLGTLHFTPNTNPHNLIELALGLAGTPASHRSTLSKQHHQKTVSETACQSQVQQTLFRTYVVEKQDSPYTHGIMKRNTNVDQDPPCTIGLKQSANHVTTVVDEWESSCAIGSICPASNGQMWTCCSTKSTLTLLDRNGATMKEIKHYACTTNIGTSATTNHLWVCDEKDNILELISDKLIHRFATKDTAKCICITSCNHVIVGMNQHISKFTTRGTLVRTNSGYWMSPFRIAECPVTQNVAVIDRGCNTYGKDGKAHVVIMDGNFNKLFDYAGELPKTSLQTAHIGSEPFSPLSMAYDSFGNLVIGDCANNLHLLVSGRGEFIRIIHKDIDCSWAAGVDDRDILWAVFGGYHVKLLQYRSI
ncbi:uncharacterized protein LOC110443483 [Mizuhopecten yessoensis]|uniref:uncharacterized protein LOC110443483 n=1 Tax=Mizuhopecten yessoensis TaxID=6573 RepID=UPI000B45CA0E|nr:uncharacterized protein LOC110443483 [Mizuhopecten yessoensis]